MHLGEFYMTFAIIFLSRLLTRIAHVIFTADARGCVTDMTVLYECIVQIITRYCSVLTLTFYCASIWHWG